MHSKVYSYIRDRLEETYDEWGDTINLNEATIRRSEDGAYYITCLLEDESQAMAGSVVPDTLDVSDAEWQQEFEEIFGEIESYVDMDAVSVTLPHIRVSPEPPLTVGATVELVVPFNGEDERELRDLLSVTSMIPSPESVSSMEAHLSSPTDAKGWNDFTVYYVTETPHKYWADCESVEDYCEMVAEHNENVTLEEMLDKDTYYGHTHLANENKGDVVSWLREFGSDYQNDIFTNDAFDGRVFLADVNSDFEGDLTLSFVVATND